jgi:hypothetical protein
VLDTLAEDAATEEERSNLERVATAVRNSARNSSRPASPERSAL